MNVIHGGCREYNNNKNLTEIWLYLSNRCQDYSIEQIGRSVTRATFYLNSPMGSNNSVKVCSFLRNAYIHLPKVKMNLVPDPTYGDSALVSSIDATQVRISGRSRCSVSRKFQLHT